MIRSGAISSVAVMPNQPPKAPDKPPREPLIIKIPPRGIRLPEQEPSKPPDQPEIEVPDPWDRWPPPEMPPPRCPEDRVAISDRVLSSWPPYEGYCSV
jgi:hypothetical protein